MDIETTRVEIEKGKLFIALPRLSLVLPGASRFLSLPNPYVTRLKVQTALFDPVGFREWTDDAPLRFIETSDVEEADFRIFFAGGAHGDPSDFDGPGGVLAHAFYPR